MTEPVGAPSPASVAQVEGAAVICPFLGLPDDPGSHFYATDLAHRCWASVANKPHRIELAYQGSMCLAGKYLRCARFNSRERAIPAWHPAAATTPMAVTGLRRQASRRPRRRRLVVAVAGILIVAAFGAALVVAAGLGPHSSPDPGIADASPTPAPSSLPSPTTSAPTASVAPTPSPPPTPTITASPAPTPSPTSTPIFHTIARGETLGYIARLYGVTVQEIVTANGIADANLIYIGQQLLIPVE